MDERITPKDLENDLSETSISNLDEMLARGEIITHREFMRQMEEQERRLMNRAMELAGNKKMEAAQLLGMNYNSMTYRRDLLGILLLEPHWGEYKKGIQSFYFPKPKSAMPETARKTLQAFLSSRGMRAEDAEPLLKSGRVHVGHDRSVWLMGDKGESALEFREDPQRKWQQKRHGKSNGAFFESVGQAKRMIVFRDPFEFALLQQRGALPGHGTASLFAMMDEHHQHRLDEILALNGHISEIHVAQSSRANEHEHEKRVTQEMKAKFNPFDIRVEGISAGLGKAKGRGPDLGL